MNTYAIYFSPTGGTEQVTKLIARNFGEYKEIDLSDKNADLNYNFSEEDICVIGVPSFGGRVPAAALEPMKGVDGGKAKAVLLVSYGNRAFEDTLVELQDFLTSKGFTCVAAATAICEHSIMHQFAAGRPDDKDKKELNDFAKKISEKIKDKDAFDTLKLPGNHPYKEFHTIPMQPQTSSDCTKCGLCAEKCPVSAIPANAPDTTDNETCISCMRCVSLCPMGARAVSEEKLSASSEKLKKLCEGRKENQLFL